MTSRRNILALSLAMTGAAILSTGCATDATSSAGSAGKSDAPLDRFPPIVFVHGNGDSASIWQTTLWRFESAGWPRERLFALDIPYPLARDDDTKAQPGRTGTQEQLAAVSAEVDKALKATGAGKVVLVTNSRGGYAVRNYAQNAGAVNVSHALLGGVPNHGVWAVKGFREANEFAGTGPFLTTLNASKNAAGDEVTGPVKWLTVRSDNNDKFAQPDGVWIGAKGTATNITAAGPELKGATNVVLPRVDHRETSFSQAAFDTDLRFLTGSAPPAGGIKSEPQPVLNGKITGLGLNSNDPASGGYTNNLPLPGAKVQVFEVDASGKRVGEAVHSKTVGADGLWGPFNAKPGTAYEFVIEAAGYATTHIYRSAFPRGSNIVHMRPERLAEADKDAGAVVIFTRPRGYFDAQRDTMSLDGQAALPGVPPAGAGVSSARLKTPKGDVRSVTGTFNGEAVTGRTWPASGNHAVVLELAY